MLTRQVAGRVYNYEYCIGRMSFTGPGFNVPTDFALGSAGSLYVLSKGTDMQQSQGLTKCTLDHKLLWESRGPEFGGGQCSWPASVAVDAGEDLYVCDDYASQVFVFDKDGCFLRSWGTKGSGDGELDRPSGLSFDAQGGLYVVDSFNHRVQKLSKEGAFLGKWGSRGSGPGELDTPWGIAIDGAGAVYVADWKNDRVQKFSADGGYLDTFGGPGTGDGELHRPSGVAVDRDGDVYVADWGNDRLNIYSPDGRFITSFSGDADALSPWAQDYVDANPQIVIARRRVDLSPERLFRRPVAVKVDDESRIMVLETQRGRIQVYAKERDFVDAPLNL